MSAVLLIMIAPLCAAAIWLEHVGPLPLIGAGWARPAPRVWPADLMGPLTAYANEQRDAAPIFNEPILGGFLIYNSPKLRVFIDGRCELYGQAFLREFVAAWRDPSRVDQWQKQFGFRAALIEADSPLRRYFDKSGQWRLVAKSPAAVFYRLNEHGSAIGIQDDLTQRRKEYRRKSIPLEQKITEGTELGCSSVSSVFSCSIRSYLRH
jgi:hypothetical protein